MTRQEKRIEAHLYGQQKTLSNSRHQMVRHNSTRASDGSPGRLGGQVRVLFNRILFNYGFRGVLTGKFDLPVYAHQD